MPKPGSAESFANSAVPRRSKSPSRRLTLQFCATSSAQPQTQRVLRAVPTRRKSLSLVTKAAFLAWASAPAGQAATYNLRIAPSGFVGTATLGCAWIGSQPRETNCAVSPASVSLDGTNAAPFTVTTTARAMAAPQFGAQRASHQPGLPLRLWLVALAVLAAGAAVGACPEAIGDRRSRVPAERPIGSRRPAGRRPIGASLLAATLLAVLLWAACGGGNPPPAQTGTPAGTYTLTLTATSGSVSRSTTLTLQVN